MGPTLKVTITIADCKFSNMTKTSGNKGNCTHAVNAQKDVVRGEATIWNKYSEAKIKLYGQDICITYRVVTPVYTGNAMNTYSCLSKCFDVDADEAQEISHSPQKKKQKCDNGVCRVEFDYWRLSVEKSDTFPNTSGSWKGEKCGKAYRGDMTLGDNKAVNLTFKDCLRVAAYDNLDNFRERCDDSDIQLESGGDTKENLIVKRGSAVQFNTLSNNHRVEVYFNGSYVCIATPFFNKTYYDRGTHFINCKPSPPHCLQVGKGASANHTKLIYYSEQWYTMLSNGSYQSDKFEFNITKKYIVMYAVPLGDEDTNTKEEEDTNKNTRSTDWSIEGNLFVIIGAFISTRAKIVV